MKKQPTPLPGSSPTLDALAPKNRRERRFFSRARKSAEQLPDAHYIAQDAYRDVTANFRRR
jgi:hypothetical protein